MNHIEAFCVMQYVCENGCREFLWNSRDGVTPFTISCAECHGSMEHMNWPDDVRMMTLAEAQRLAPKPIKRVFLDASPYHKHIIESAKEYVDKWWDRDAGGGLTMKKTMYPMNKSAAAEYFVKTWTAEGSPTVLTVEDFEALHV